MHYKTTLHPTLPPDHKPVSQTVLIFSATEVLDKEAGLNEDEDGPGDDNLDEDGTNDPLATCMGSYVTTAQLNPQKWALSKQFKAAVGPTSGLPLPVRKRAVLEIAKALLPNPDRVNLGMDLIGGAQQHCHHQGGEVVRKTAAKRLELIFSVVNKLGVVIDCPEGQGPGRCLNVGQALADLGDVAKKYLGAKVFVVHDSAALDMHKERLANADNLAFGSMRATKRQVGIFSSRHSAKALGPYCSSGVTYAKNLEYRQRQVVDTIAGGATSGVARSGQPFSCVPLAVYLAAFMTRLADGRHLGRRVVQDEKVIVLNSAPPHEEIVDLVGPAQARTDAELKKARLEQFSALPGVQPGDITSVLPRSGGGLRIYLSVEGRTRREPIMEAVRQKFNIEPAETWTTEAHGSSLDWGRGGSCSSSRRGLRLLRSPTPPPSS